MTVWTIAAGAIGLVLAAALSTAAVYQSAAVPSLLSLATDRSYGLVYSQRVLLALTEAGLPRQAAYEIVQRDAMRAWRERRSFLECLQEDEAVTGRLSPEALKSAFDPAWYLRHVDTVYRRLGLAP